MVLLNYFLLLQVTKNHCTCTLIFFTSQCTHPSGLYIVQTVWINFWSFAVQENHIQLLTSNNKMHPTHLSTHIQQAMSKSFSGGVTETWLLLILVLKVKICTNWYFLLVMAWLKNESMSFPQHDLLNSYVTLCWNRLIIKLVLCGSQLMVLPKLDHM